jgi:hypothetical protein
VKKLRQSLLGPIGGFLESVIDAVSIASVEVPEFELLFGGDPRLAAISRGFLLASRVLAHFDVHPCSVPALPPTATCELWGFWDLILDVVSAQGDSDEDPFRDIFACIDATFRNFQSAAVCRLLAFFLTVPGYREEATELLYHGGPTPILTRCLGQCLVRALLVAPGALGYLVIARIVLDSAPGADDVAAIVAHLTRDLREPAIIRALMLAICCCICHETAADRCIGEGALRYAEDGAPFSAILFGMLRAKGCAFANVNAFRMAFEKVASDENADRRAAAVFALGQTWDLRAIPEIAQRLHDPEDIVVEEAVIALAVALRFDTDRFRLDDEVLESVRKGIEEVKKRDSIRPIYESAKMEFENFFDRLEGRTPKRTQDVRFELEMRLVQKMKKSVRDPQLAERYQDAMFSSV